MIVAAVRTADGRRFRRWWSWRHAVRESAPGRAGLGGAPQRLGDGRWTRGGVADASSSGTMGSWWQRSSSSARNRDAAASPPFSLARDCRAAPVRVWTRWVLAAEPKSVFGRDNPGAARLFTAVRPLRSAGEPGAGAETSLRRGSDGVVTVPLFALGWALFSSGSRPRQPHRIAGNTLLLGVVRRHRRPGARARAGGSDQRLRRFTRAC